MKLTIELVPRTCWYSNVRSEVTTSQWNKLKLQTFTAAGHICEICQGTGKKWPVECHEIWNYDDENKIQRLDGLISLCPSCHEVKHIGLAQIKGRYKIARKHLAKVNEITIEEAETYIRESFHIWNIRGQSEWQLELNWLDQNGMLPQ